MILYWSLHAKLAKDSEKSVRQELAKRHDVSVEILQELAKDKEFIVYEQVARNPMIDEEIIEQSLQSLSKIFHIGIQELKEELLVAKVINWPHDPFALGAYSYPTPETPAAVAELLTPVDNKLFFAGEALSPGDITGTVEAALVSGQRAANAILLIQK